MKDCILHRFWQDKKTGWYFDQRVNHRQVEKWASQGQKVLDVFSYQGGFGFAAAKSGADVVMVDCSQAAIEMSQKTFAHHGLAAKWHQADAWDFYLPAKISMIWLSSIHLHW